MILCKKFKVKCRKTCNGFRNSLMACNARKTFWMALHARKLETGTVKYVLGAQ